MEWLSFAKVNKWYMSGFSVSADYENISIFPNFVDNFPEFSSISLIFLCLIKHIESSQRAAHAKYVFSYYFPPGKHVCCKKPQMIFLAK